MSNFNKAQSHVTDKIFKPFANHIANSEGSISFVRPTTFLLLAISFAILAGLAEALFLSFNKFILNNPFFISPNFVWTIPLANVIIFFIPGVILYLIALIKPNVVPVQIASFLYGFLGFLALLLLIPRLHSLAAVLLAAGLALQVTRILTKRSNAWQNHVKYNLGRLPFGKRTGDQRDYPQPPQFKNKEILVARRQFVLGAGAAVAGLALSVQGWERLRERQALSSLVHTSSEAPNILLIVLDTVRANSLSLLGYTRPTSPQLERLAKSAVTFEQALSTSSWTLPSHASMFTGRFPHELSTGFLTPLDDTYPTLAEVLTAQGYLTAGFVANTDYCSYEFGLNRGFVHYEDYSISSGEIIRSSQLARLAFHSQLRQMAGYDDRLGRKSAEQINNDFLGWLSKQDHKRPIFAFLNYFDAHDPYLPPEDFALMFSPSKSRGHLPPMGTALSEQEVEELKSAYDGSIAYLDDQLGLLFDQLDQRNWLNNTLVIITSDHGEQFGEHGLMGHANSLYMPLLRVPLLISFPSRVPVSVRVPELVTLRDLPATVLDLAGLKGGVQFPGDSLARYWNDSIQKPQPILSESDAGIRQPEWYPTAEGDIKSVAFHGMHYIQNHDSTEELYDLDSDPQELHNLAGRDGSSDILERFRSTLEIMLNRN